MTDPAEKSVTAHYTARQNMANDILEQARGRTSNPDNLTPDDLKYFDEMHVGGYHATQHFIPKLGLSSGMKVLDIGSGIGGPARFAAANYDVHVTGIDLTPSYKSIAETLSAAVNMTEQTEFVTGSATNMAFDDGAFDAAYTMHVGMNIQDKAALYSETARVLKSGGVFGVYDTLLLNPAYPLAFPLPWADTTASSFLTTPDELEQYLKDAGFAITEIEDRKDFAIERLTKLKQSGESTLGAALDNILEQIKGDILCPGEIICKKTS